MTHTLIYADMGMRCRVQVDCSLVQAGRIARLLPGGAIERPAWPRDPEQAALLAVLTVRDFLKRVAEATQC